MIGFKTPKSNKLFNSVSLPQLKTNKLIGDHQNTKFDPKNQYNLSNINKNNLNVIIPNLNDNNANKIIDVETKLNKFKTGKKYNSNEKLQSIPEQTVRQPY